MSAKTRLLFVLFLAVSTVTVAWGQGDRGTIRGTVKDPSSAVVPNAAITIIRVETNSDFKATTSSTGDFTIPNLPSGTYRVRAEMGGFKSLIREGISLAAGETVSLELHLDVGATQDTVSVTAEAPLLQTDNARVATQISTKLINDLPVVVNGGVRSPFDLAAVTADVTSSGGFRIGGGRAGSFGMTLDGTSITVSNTNNNALWSLTNTPSVEAIQEFAVESSGFKAESGNASGGSVSFVSKSGSNAFHGSAYEYLRNQKMDARGWIYYAPGTTTNIAKPVLKQNNFGFTAGGPVIIPKIYNGSNKTFFFFSYEGFRNRVGASTSALSVPPPEFYNGDFHNWVDQNAKMYVVYDPAATLNGTTYSRLPYSGNLIPADKIDPVAKAITSYVKPLIAPNSGAAPGTSAYVRQNYFSSGTQLHPNDKYSLKVDQQVTTNQRVSVYYGHSKDVDLYGAQGPPGLPAPLSGNPGYNRSHIWRLNHDYSIRPTLLNRFYLGYNNFKQNHGSFGTVTGSPQSEGLPTIEGGWKSRGICIPNYPDCDSNFPATSFGDGFAGWGVAGPNGSDNLVKEIREDLTKVAGAHTFKGGFFYNDSHYNGFGVQNMAGNTSYSFNATSVPLGTNQNTAGGSGFASLLLGQVNGYGLDTPRYLATAYRSTAAYFQDDWRVNSKLTLNVGVRWEMRLPMQEDKDQLSDLDPNLANPAAGGIPGALIFAGSGPGRIGKRSLIDSWNDWAPRFGFSFVLDSKTTVRGSAGRSFGPLLHTGNSSHNLGFVQRITANSTSQGLTPLWILKNGAPYWAPVPVIDPSVGNGANVPYYNGRSGNEPSDEFNFAFDIQRQLNSSFALDVGYVGTMAARIQSNLLALNALPYKSLPANMDPFTASGRTVLASLIGSAGAAGTPSPFPAFSTLWGTGANVSQAKRPFPQYSGIDTANGGGDRIGHSTYNALEVKLTKRYGSGLSFQGSYVFSKYLTDSDAGATMDIYNRSLEKAVAGTDQTHVAKFIYSWDLPFGKGKALFNGGIAGAITGGWRVSAIHTYSSGSAISLGTTQSFPLSAGGNRPTITTYDGWRADYTGDFDPNIHSFFQPLAWFGPQSTTQLGNATRTNPKVKNFPSLNESISLARNFNITEALKVEFRAETFNALNRVRFGSLGGGTTLQNANFGLWRSQANTPRQVQMSLRMYW